MVMMPSESTMLVSVDFMLLPSLRQIYVVSYIG